VAPDPQPDPRQRDPRQRDLRPQGQQDPQFLADEAPEGRQQSQPVMITGNMKGERSTYTVGAVPCSAVATVHCAVCLYDCTEEPGEQCTVVFALIVTEPSCECDVGWWRVAIPPLPPTIQFPNNLCKDDSTLFSMFLHGIGYQLRLCGRNLLLVPEKVFLDKCLLGT
jgi:hypothetical protein